MLDRIPVVFSEDEKLKRRQKYRLAAANLIIYLPGLINDVLTENWYFIQNGRPAGLKKAGKHYQREGFRFPCVFFSILKPLVLSFQNVSFYLTFATGMSSQRVVHAGESISRFIFHSALIP